jgi:hypothetical protein
MTKTLVKDEKGKLARQRTELVNEIDSAWVGLQASLEQLRRRHYHKLGELFIQLRMTFDKGHDGDIKFASFCKKEFPAIDQPRRAEYMAYRKKLGPVTSISVEIDLPPLREVTSPRDNAVKVEKERAHAQYGRIVDDEINEPEDFAVPRTKRETENELVVELAYKIINTGFRTLSTKMHPDKDGGSNEAQKRLSLAKKLLEDALERQSLRM